MADAVPVEFVTRTSSVCGVIVPGVVAVIDVAEFTTTFVAAVPTVTVEPVVKKVPVIVIDVPPPDGPEVGLTPVTVAAALPLLA